MAVDRHCRCTGLTGVHDRVTDAAEEITGRPAESVEEFVAHHRDVFAE